MTKKMKLFLIICAAVVGLGLLFSFIGYICGGIKGLGKIEQRMPWIDFGISQGEEQKSYTLEDFDSMNIQTDIGSVELIQGDEYKVEATYDKKWPAPSVEVSNHTLTVTDNDKKYGWLGLNIFGNSDRSSTIKIYYPKGASFDEVAIDSDLGDIRIEGLKANTLKIQADAGNVEGTNIITKGIDADLNVGQLKLDGSFAGVTKVYCDMGDCILLTDLPREDYSINAQVDLGDYEVDGQTGTGNYNVKATTADNSMELKCDLGNIKLKFE